MVMKALRILGSYHWGYWIRMPFTSKFQFSLPIPPPTTLMGALAKPIFTNFILTGETIYDDRLGSLLSPVYLIEKEGLLKACSIYLLDQAFYWEDINIYILLHFQELTKSTKEEKEAGGRRYLLKYRKGAIPTGKVFYPDGRFIAVYLIDENVGERILGKDWEIRLIKASYEINRIGSKESIVSIHDVEIINANIIEDRKVRTKFYFRADLAEDIRGSFYREKFWRSGWGRKMEAVFLEYIIPGRRIPIESASVDVFLSEKANAYYIGKDEVIIF